MDTLAMVLGLNVLGGSMSSPHFGSGEAVILEVTFKRLPFCTSPTSVGAPDRLVTCLMSPHRVLLP